MAKTTSTIRLWGHKRTHGRSRTRAYRIWTHMKMRCYNPQEAAKGYQARGITVCDRWRWSFENFLADMGDPPPGLTIERKNNDLGYSPENCVWATHTEQMNNTRKSRLLTYHGETLTMAQWARKLGVKRSTLEQRFYCYHWTVEKTLSTPII